MTLNIENQITSSNRESAFIPQTRLSTSTGLSRCCRILSAFQKVSEKWESSHPKSMFGTHRCKRKIASTLTFCVYVNPNSKLIYYRTYVEKQGWKNLPQKTDLQSSSQQPTAYQQSSASASSQRRSKSYSMRTRAPPDLP